jgi:hypothetical protein
MCANKTRAGSFEEDEPRVDHDAATRAGYVLHPVRGGVPLAVRRVFRRRSAR